MQSKSSVIFAMVFALFGCTSINKSGVTPVSHLTGPLPTDASLRNVEASLARRVLIVPGDDQENVITITAILQTEPLIVAQEREMVKRGKATAEAAKRSVRETARALVKNKTCFLIDIKSARGGNRSDMEYWRGRLESPAGKLQTMTFKELRRPASDRDPVVDFLGSSLDPEQISQYAFGCSAKAVSLNRPVRLHISAKWDTSGTWHTLEWL